MSDFCVYHIGIFTTVTLLSRRRWSARCQPGSIRAGSLTVEGKGSEGGREGGAPSLSDSFVTVAAEAEAGVAQGAAARRRRRHRPPTAVDAIRLDAAAVG